MAPAQFLSVVLLASTAAAATSHALPPLFNAPFTAYDLGTTRPRHVALADLTRDGLHEIVVAGDSAVHVFRNLEDGTFQEVARHAIRGRLSSVAIGDCDADGFADIVVGREGSVTTISILYGRGDGTIEMQQDIWVDWAPRWVALGDINRDTNLDIVVTIQSGLQVLYGRGDRTFSPVYRACA
ncbi:MAG: FG-GAP repeat domain-containing protein [Candidatus Krumholzibacteriia bacterium]